MLSILIIAPLFGRISSCDKHETSIAPSFLLLSFSLSFFVIYPGPVCVCVCVDVHRKFEQKIIFFPSSSSSCCCSLEFDKFIAKITTQNIAANGRGGMVEIIFLLIKRDLRISYIK